MQKMYGVISLRTRENRTTIDFEYSLDTFYQMFMNHEN